MHCVAFGFAHGVRSESGLLLNHIFVQHSLKVPVKRNGFISRNNNRRQRVISKLESKGFIKPENGNSSFSHPRLSLRRDIANLFSGDTLGLEIFSIAWPSLLALAAEPIASLTDTFFIGQIGPVELGAAGVSASVFNLVSKIFNFPLVNITTSFVAEEEALRMKTSAQLAEQGIAPSSSLLAKPSLPSVSVALVLGTALGLLEAAILIGWMDPILSIMGVPRTSAMFLPASDYLFYRAIGAPAVIISLATQGVFRGFKDTRTPLASTVAASLLNVLLDPLLMFSCGFGVKGAAVATILAQYLQAGFLVLRLSDRVSILPLRLSGLEIGRFLRSGGLLMGRTVALLGTVTLATSMAARLGPSSMAAHQISLQIWLAASLLSDSLALAGQTLVAGAFAKGDHQLVKEIMLRTLLLGTFMGLVTSVLLSLGASAIPAAFTSDPLVLGALAVTFPFIAGTQVITSLAFVFDGIHYGAADFSYAAISMLALILPVVGVLLLAPQFLGLGGVWMGLTLLMSLRMFAGFCRVGSASGPWKILKQPAGENEGASVDGSN